MCIRDRLAEARDAKAARKVLEQSIEELKACEEIKGFASRGKGPNPGREWLSITYWALSEVCDQLGDRAASREADTYSREFSGPGGFGGHGGPWWGGKKDGFGGGKKDGFGGGKKDWPPKN